VAPFSLYFELEFYTYLKNYYTFYLNLSTTLISNWEVTTIAAVCVFLCSHVNDSLFHRPVFVTSGIVVICSCIWRGQGLFYRRPLVARSFKRSCRYCYAPCYWEGDQSVTVKLAMISKVNRLRLGNLAEIYGGC